MQIHQSGPAVILLGGILHIGARCFQAGEKSGADRNDAEQRKKAFLCTPRTPQRIAKKRVFFHPISLYYQMISDTGTGSACTVTSETCPPRSSMTLSAIGVSARLCVMMMTVMPSVRQQSWSSCKTAFPV